jgi:hypothetical protein
VSWQPEQRDVLEDLQQVGRIVNQLQFVMLFLVALNLALLALIWLLAVRSPGEWLRWTGMPLLLLGLLTLLLAWLIPQIVNWGLDGQALWVEGDLPTALTRALDAAIRDFSQQLFRPARLAGAVLAVVGLLLTLVSVLFPSPEQQAPAAYDRGMS